MSELGNLGWANKVAGRLDLRTVGPTKRSVMVNALWLAGKVVQDRWPDELIESTYNVCAERSGWQLVAVEVRELGDG